MPSAKTPRPTPQLPDELIERIFEPVFQHYAEVRRHRRRESDPTANDCLVLSKRFYRVLYKLRFRQVTSYRDTSRVALMLARLAGDEGKKAWLTRLTFKVFPDFTAVHAFALLQLRNLEQLVAHGSKGRLYDDPDVGDGEASYHFLPDFWANISRFPRLTHLAYTAEFTWPRGTLWQWSLPGEKLPRFSPSTSLESATVCFNALNPVIQTFLEESGVQHFGMCLTSIEDLRESRRNQTGLIPFRTMRNLRLEVNDRFLGPDGWKSAIDDVIEKVGFLISDAERGVACLTRLHSQVQAQVKAVCLDTLRVEAEDFATGIENSFLPSLRLCAVTRCEEFAFVAYDYNALKSDFASVYAPDLRHFELEIPCELAKTVCAIETCPAPGQARRVDRSDLQQGDLARLIKLLCRLPNLINLQVRRSDLEHYERRNVEGPRAPRLLEMDDRAIADRYPDLRTILDYLGGTQVKSFGVKGSKEQGSARWQRNDVSATIRALVVRALSGGQRRL